MDYEIGGNIMGTKTPFFETKDMFIQYLGYTKPYSYAEWKSLKEDDRAAALYVQFFSQIILAWRKNKTSAVEDEDGVDVILQYLIKNVPKISEDSKRFTPNYIYRVASNCMVPICSRVQKSQDRINLEISIDAEIESIDSESINLGDSLCISEDDVMSSYIRMEIWKIIHDLKLSDSMMDCIYKMCSTNSKLTKRNKKDKEVIIKKLREVLIDYSE